MKCVIAEDEEAAREVLKSYLNKYCPRVTVAGEAKNGKQAIEVIHKMQPDLVFLDVEMPLGNAFDVLEGCSELNFATIFITAYSDYAIQALNQSASYYLLKPLSIEELIKAVDKVTQDLDQKVNIQRNSILLENHKEKQPYRQQVILPTLNGFDVVKMEEIIRLKGNGNFTDIHLVDGSRKMVCRFLKHYEEMLPRPFIRVHKSHIINLNHIVSYQKGSKGFVTLTDLSEVEISSSYKEVFLKEMV